MSDPKQRLRAVLDEMAGPGLEAVIASAKEHIPKGLTNELCWLDACYDHSNEVLLMSRSVEGEPKVWIMRGVDAIAGLNEYTRMLVQ